MQGPIGAGITNGFQHGLYLFSVSVLWFPTTAPGRCFGPEPTGHHQVGGLLANVPNGDFSFNHAFDCPTGVFQVLLDVLGRFIVGISGDIVNGSIFGIAFIIIVTGGNGICFPGSDPSFAEYGKLDEDGSILESVGTWMRQSDGSYIYSENG